MKKTTFLILCLFSFILGYSQDNEEYKSLFKEKEGNTFLVSQKFQFTEFDDNLSFMIGAGGGKIFNHNFLLGGGGYGTFKGIAVKEKNHPPLNLNDKISHNLHFGYGGFWTGYMHNWHKTFHLTPSMFWAMGAISIRRNDTEKSVADDLVYILQPMLELEINLTEFVRISFVPSYRFVFAVDMNGYKNKNFSGIGGIFFIKFGAF